MDHPQPEIIQAILAGMDNQQRATDAILRRFDPFDNVTHRRPSTTDGRRTDMQDALHEESLRSDHPRPTPLRSDDARTRGPFGQPPAAMSHAGSRPLGSSTASAHLVTNTPLPPARRQCFMTAMTPGPPRPSQGLSLCPSDAPTPHHGMRGCGSAPHPPCSGPSLHLLPNSPPAAAIMTVF
jgi:hypothetical protein